MKDRTVISYNHHMGISVTAVIDIGGSKIAYGLLSHTDDLVPIIHYQNKEPFKKGISALQSSIRHICHDIQVWASNHKIIINPTIIVGSAGNFKPNSAIILPGTAINLGKTPDEFDHIDMSKLVTESCDYQFNCLVFNDAVLQLAGAVIDVTQQKIALLDKKIAYIGPGTGLGGAFARHTKSGLKVMTDGHIFDMQLKDPQGNSVMAEDVFSGRGFYQRYKVSLKDINQSKDLFADYQEEVKQLGDYLAQIMIHIYQGKFKKLSPYLWDKSDYEQIKETTCFMIGGSIGSKGKIAQVICDIAAQNFKMHTTKSALIVKVPNTIHAALKGGWVMGY